MTDFLPFTLYQLVEVFRAQFDAPPSYPLDIETAVLQYSLLCIEFIPTLTVDRVQAWLQKRLCPMAIRHHGIDRDLYGCLVVDCGSGRGYIFVERDCSPEQQRFTIAHELAHYLRDYHAPRERALERWGEAIRPVLDGQRPATVEERLNAILQRVPLGIYQHLMLRDVSGNIVTMETQESENCADQIALELLAPHHQLLSGVATKERLIPEVLQTRLIPVLQAEYGLPESIAWRYALQLAACYGYRPTVRDWFR